MLAPLWVVLLLVSCGGRVEREPDPSEDPSTTNQTTGSASATDESGSGNSGVDPNLVLEKCSKGWAPDTANCPWLASDGLCYATKVAACSCICPRKGPSTCLSGLPGGADSRTSVSCI